MKSQIVPKALLCAGLLNLWIVEAPAQEQSPSHWEYSGKDGPKNWGKLNPAYSTCSMGHNQSPINITGAKKSDLPALSFAYSKAPLNIVNNGHTIQVNYPPGSSLTVGGTTYALKQFHFHHPSEEHVDGRGYDLVAHLVHADDAGHLAVVAVLFQVGGPSAFLDTFWKNIPEEKDKDVVVPTVILNVADLLPATLGYYTFEGSLTTPPCSEGVTWFVLKTPVSLSTAQLESFAKRYPRDARPIQPANGREIRETE
jgi:carbonic anhydrase